MRKITLSLTCLLLSIFSFSQAHSSFFTPVSTTYYFDWGDDSTKIVVTQYGTRKGLAMVHLHDDEISSAEAAKKILTQTAGVFIEIENNGKRLISFTQDGKRFQFDPNRIFTAKGRYQNLHSLNKTVTSEAESSVRAFATFILNKIPKSVVTLLAVHNNKNGNYSIKSYKGASHSDVLKYYRNKEKDPDNFFIVNNNEMFKEIKRSGYNVVLQNSKKATDDGSLSIYFGKKNLVYVNVETEKGNLDEQVKMINAIFNILD